MELRFAVGGGSLRAGSLVVALLVSCVSASSAAGAPRVDLGAVAATSSKDAWAVGSYFQGGDKALVEHWNGSAWKIVLKGVKGGGLDAVAALSPTNVWAVGTVPRHHLDRGLIEHWNGSSWQAQIQSGQYSTELNAISATSASNVWVAGSYADGDLLERWNGTAWTQEANPPAGRGTGDADARLSGVKTLSPSDIWAVGWPLSTDTGFIEHWDGSSWTSQTSAEPGHQNYLYGVTAVSDKDAWAVGGYQPSGVGVEQAWIENWNGLSWTTQVAAKKSSALGGVTATSGGNAWAVGDQTASHNTVPLIEHWNGSSWSIQSSPKEAGGLRGIAATAANNAWAVGGNLIEHWNGSAWKIQPSPSP